MAEAERWDAVVIGGGIVGLAACRAVLQRLPGGAVMLCERESELARHQTGHNSGVIHSGVYYKPGSLKARLTVAGARALREYCAAAGVPMQTPGKVIVATTAEELPRLEELHRRAAANGVPDAALIGPERLRELEPQAAGLRALHVPGTGIVDYRGVAAALGRDIAAAGGELRTSCAAFGARREGGEWIVETSRGILRTRRLLTCGGLQADRVAAACGAPVKARIVPFRGDYYELTAPARGLVNGLIYPVPDPAFPFLGVHFTRTVHGGVEAGPNAVLAWAREGYRRGAFRLRDAAATMLFPGFWRMAARHWRMGLAEWRRARSRALFGAALRRLVPALRDEDLEPAPSGVRAQALLPDGGLADDFLLHELDGAVHVINAPSPAATASLEIGRYLAEKLIQPPMNTDQHG